MIHHDSREYGQAVKEAQIHLEETIQKKAASAIQVIEKVQDEQPNDRIVGTHGIRFAYRTKEAPIPIKGDDVVLLPKHTILMGTRQHNTDNAFEEDMHKHALNQAAGRAGVPETFVNRMLERPYGAELICENLNTIFAKEGPERLLVRSVKGAVRGVLSDAYRRLDSRPLIEMFAKSCQEIGAVPIEGVGGDLRFALKAVLPKAYLVGTGKQGNEEALAFGLQFSHSDFGCGALSLSVVYIRCWCTNTATRESLLRQRHLGKRLEDDVVYAQETYEADTRATTLALRDNIRGALGPANIETMVAAVNKALDTSIEPKKFFERGGELEKLKLSKGEVEQARDVYMNAGVEVLPRGDSLYRMSNTLSWIAQTSETAERRLELERAAGQLLDKVA